MRALVLTSNSLRHKYFLKMVDDNFNLVGVVSENKGKYYSEQEKNSALIQKHFERLRETERLFFSKDLCDFDISSLNVKYIAKDEINQKQVIDWAISLNPSVVFLFGTGILKDEWLNRFENTIINLHLGLSPFYKGSATLFWPFANDELECIGATIHLAVQKVDAGDILIRVKPDINKFDNYYTINYKLIKEAINILPKISKSYLAGEIKIEKQVGVKNKFYRKKDFNENVLKQVIDNYGENIPVKTIVRIKRSDRCVYCL
jgi:methionyl-tRNA formyltransferase